MNNIMYVVYSKIYLHKGRKTEVVVRLLGVFNSIDSAKQFVEVNEYKTTYIDAVCKGD